MANMRDKNRWQIKVSLWLDELTAWGVRSSVLLPHR